MSERAAHRLLVLTGNGIEPEPGEEDLRCSKSLDTCCKNLGALLFGLGFFAFISAIMFGVLVAVSWTIFPAAPWRAVQCECDDACQQRPIMPLPVDALDLCASDGQFACARQRDDACALFNVTCTDARGSVAHVPAHLSRSPRDFGRHTLDVAALAVNASARLWQRAAVVPRFDAAADDVSLQCAEKNGSVLVERPLSSDAKDRILRAFDQQLDDATCFTWELATLLEDECLQKAIPREVFTTFRIQEIRR